MGVAAPRAPFSGCDPGPPQKTLKGGSLSVLVNSEPTVA